MRDAVIAKCDGYLGNFEPKLKIGKKRIKLSFRGCKAFLNECIKEQERKRYVVEKSWLQEKQFTLKE
jgi:hypothetical protein